MWSRVVIDANCVSYPNIDVSFLQIKYLDLEILYER